MLLLLRICQSRVWLTVAWESGIEYRLIALARSQPTTIKVDLSVLGEVAYHLMIRRGNDFHVVKPRALHDGVKMG